MKFFYDFTIEKAWSTISMQCMQRSLLVCGKIWFVCDNLLPIRQTTTKCFFSCGLCPVKQEPPPANKVCIQALAKKHVEHENLLKHDQLAAGPSVLCRFRWIALGNTGFNPALDLHLLQVVDGPRRGNVFKRNPDRPREQIAFASLQSMLAPCVFWLHLVEPDCVVSSPFFESSLCCLNHKTS